MILRGETKMKKWIIAIIILFIILAGIGLYFFTNNNANNSSDYEAQKTATETNQNQASAEQQNPQSNNEPAQPSPEQASAPEPTPTPTESEELATFSTKIYTKDSSRQNNITLTCSTLNDTDVAPASTFSFCNTVGRSSPSKGYTKADVFSNGKKTKGYGGRQLPSKHNTIQRRIKSTRFKCNRKT